MPNIAELLMLALFGVQVIAGLTRITILHRHSTWYRFISKLEWHAFACGFLLGIWIADETAHALVGSAKMFVLAYPAIPCLVVLAMIMIERGMREPKRE